MRFHSQIARPSRCLIQLLLGLASIACATSLAGAQDEAFDDDTAVKSAREGLGGWTSYSWYDEANDDLRPLNVKQPDPPPPPQTGSSWFGDFFGSLFEAFGFFLTWILIPAICGLIIYFLIRAYLQRENREALVQSPEEEEEEYDIDRIEALPTQIRAPSGDLLSEARRHYEAGDYRLAIIYLYSHQLLRLDKKQLIRLSKGKTNRQYLREIASRQTVKELFEPTMLTFEDVFFGGRDLTRAAFEACWQRQEPFESQLQGATP